MSTAAPAKIAIDPIRSEPAYSPDTRWQFGFVLLGILLGSMGSFLVYWRYYLEGEPAVAGSHFAGLNLGYLLALALPQRFRRTGFGAKRLAVFGSLLAMLSLASLPLLGPPRPADLRIVALVFLGGSAGLLTLSLLRVFESQYVGAPFRAANRSTLLFGLGSFGGTLSLALFYMLVPDERTIGLLVVVPFLFLCCLRGAKLPVAQGASTPEEERPVARSQSTLATVLFRCLLLVQVGSEWAIAGWLPLFLIGRAGLSPGLALLSLALYLFLLFALRPAGLAVYRHWRPKPALTVSIALALLALLLLSSGTTLPLLLSATVLLAVGLAPVLPLVWRDLDERFSFQQNFYRGSLAVAVTGAMTVPFLMGWVQTLFGIRYVMLLPAFGCALSLCLSFLMSFEAHLMVGGKGAERSEPS